MKKNNLDRKYAAFISYRHVLPDKRIARLLQFLLEYNLVRPNKNVPRRIRPVFLDVTELPVEADLDESIIKALDQSDTLFVICSPDLPASKYCLREISYFKQIHGGNLDRIGTLLVRGEPQEAFPQSLRTKTVTDADGTKREVESEPLFADVRGKTSLHAICRLVFSEYLRLAARHYACSYDELKKRHKRTLIQMLSVVLLIASLVCGALIHKSIQVQSIKANSYATYAAEQTQADNEILALALCTQQEFRPTQAYTAALRSALVQRDYKQKATPVANVMSVDYPYSIGTNYYLSHDGAYLIVADSQIWNLVDAKNGQIIHQFSYEAAAVTDKSPKSYVVFDSHPDESGVFRDYITLRDLKNDQVIGQFPFREASADTPKYKLVTAVETDTLLAVQDHGEYVAFLTSDGEQLSLEEFIARAQPFLSAQNQQEEAPYYVSQSNLHKTYSVKNAQGETVLELKGGMQNSAFSADWSRFAYAADNMLFVYDTGDWSQVGETHLLDAPVQSLQLLQNSNCYIAGYRDGSQTQSVVADCISGEVYLQTTGTILVSPVENAFFTIYDGKICRYECTTLDTGSVMQVQQAYEQRFLFQSSQQDVLYDALSGAPVLEAAAGSLCADAELKTILVNNSQTIACYDENGALRWEQPAEAVLTAVSPDGTHCAWSDEAGVIHVLSAADGTQIRTVNGAADAGAYQQIFVSDSGVGMIGTETVLWISNTGARSRLGQYTGGTLFRDGLLILESNARVNDFHIFDTVKGCSFSPQADNTGKWVYAPQTGYLIRHVESSGNNPSLYLEVWKRKGTELDYCGQIDLADTQVQFLRVDSTGNLLSLTAGGRSRIYRLDTMESVLNASCQVFYESNVLYGQTAFGDSLYSMPVYEVAELTAKAKESIQGARGVRTLSEEEWKRYTLSEE